MRDIPEELDAGSQSDENEDNYGGEDEDYDLDDEDDDDNDDDIDDENDCKIIEEIDTEFREGLQELSTPNWLTDSDEGAADLISSETCDCYHCVSQAQQEQLVSDIKTWEIKCL